MIAKDPPPTQEEANALEAEIIREQQSVEDTYFKYIAIARKLLEPEPVNHTNHIMYLSEPQINSLSIKLRRYSFRNLMVVMING